MASLTRDHFHRFVHTLLRFRRSRSGVAAVEFVIIMPLFLGFLMAGSETARYVMTGRRLTELANSLASLVAERQAAVQYNDLLFLQGSAAVTFPAVLADATRKGVPWKSDISLTVSSVQFTPTVNGCTSGCTYKANAVWSLNFNGTGRCSASPLTPAADDATPTPTTLPQDAFTSGSAVVADVVYNYTPLFGSALIGALTFKRSVYLQPRYVPLVQYQYNAGDPTNPTC